MADKDKPSWDAKLDWARKHLEAFDGEVNAFFADKPVRSRVEIDRESQRIRIWGEMAKEVPDHWPLMVGDIVHNLRGALDHIVWALSLKNPAFASAPEGQKRQIQFPICVEKGEYFGRRFPKPREGQQKRRARFVDAAPLTIIDSLQPFQRPDPKGQDLAILNELSNEDKHHAVLIGAMVIHLPLVSFGGFGGPITDLATAIHGTNRVAGETPLLELVFYNPIPDREVKVEPHPLGQVAVYQSGPGSPLIAAVEFLKNAHNRIGKLVIPLLQKHL